MLDQWREIDMVRNLRGNALRVGGFIVAVAS